MTRIKLCGLSRIRDIETANALAPDYVGFVFAENSRRYVTPEQAAERMGVPMKFVRGCMRKLGMEESTK